MKCLKNIFTFIFLFLFCFIFFYVIQALYCDEIWAYGFSYNISSGMIIYKDFDCLQMPLYFFIVSFFIKIFGNYVIVMHIFDSLLFASIFMMLKRIIGWKFLILLPLFAFVFPSGYNLLCLFILFVIIYLININKYNDLFVAVLLGLCFITKQNIGIILFLPCLFYAKNKLKCISGFVIPFLVICVYMVWHRAFYEFVDHCFLGLFEFGSKNLHLESILFLIIILIVFVMLFNILFKGKFINKEIFYIMMFLLISYPIFDIRHLACAMFPVFYLFFKFNSNKYFLIIMMVFVWDFFIKLIFSIGFDINLERDVYYLRNDIVDVNKREIYNYVEGNENFYILDVYSYYLKLYYNVPISRFDFMLNGNLGYNGVSRRLEELEEFCSSNMCYFFVPNVYRDSEVIIYSQEYDFYKFIVDNYDIHDSISDFDIYVS